MALENHSKTMDWVAIPNFLVVLEEVLLDGAAVRVVQQQVVIVVVGLNNTGTATAVAVVPTTPARTRTTRRA